MLLAEVFFKAFFNVFLLSIAVLAAPEIGSKSDTDDLAALQPRLFFKYPWFPLPQITRPTAATTGGTTALPACTIATAAAPSVRASTVACMCGTSTTPCPTTSYCSTAGVCTPSGVACVATIVFPCICGPGTGTTTNICLAGATTPVTACMVNTGVCS